jgi:hypothetical protein
MERTGFVKSDTLIEDLVPFLDHGPKDAGGLASRCLARPQ